MMSTILDIEAHFFSYTKMIQSSNHEVVNKEEPDCFISINDFPNLSLEFLKNPQEAEYAYKKVKIQVLTRSCHIYELTS